MAMFVGATVKGVLDDRSGPTSQSATVPGTEQSNPPAASETDKGTPELDFYRVQDRERIVAALLADSSILAVGSEGSGKSTLLKEVVKQLGTEGFVVVEVEQGTPKNMLKEMAEQLGLSAQTLEGRSLSADQLKSTIAAHLLQLPHQDKVFLVIDDAHKCDARFRDWLKTLKRHQVPMFLTATDPPRTDIFLNMPRTELEQLPESAIREIMERVARERKLNLKRHQFAKLQERVGGNPMLAKRVIDEEYLGLETEGGDHNRYTDGAPILLIVGVFFAVFRFIGLGTGNPTLYMIAGIGTVIFLGASRLIWQLPREGRRIQS